jgi:hypothetical protein
MFIGLIMNTVHIVYLYNVDNYDFYRKFLRFEQLFCVNASSHRYI